MLIIGKLSALKVAREKRPGLYGDGGGPINPENQHRFLASMA